MHDRPESQAERYRGRRDEILARRRKLVTQEPRTMMLWGAKRRAKARGLEFNLSVDDVVIPDLCPVLGIPLVRGDGRWTDNSPSLDRVDNSKGYTPDNICVISRRANTLKTNASLTELE